MHLSFDSGAERRGHPPIAELAHYVWPYGERESNRSRGVIRKVGKHAYNAYLKWLLNDSPYATCFLSSEVEEGQYVDINVEEEQHLTYQALIALRISWENFYVPQAWYTLVKLGADKRMAFLIAHLIMADENIIRIQHKGEGHLPLYPHNFTDEEVKSFLLATPLVNTGVPFKDIKRYTGNSDIWKKVGGVKGQLEKFVKGSLPLVAIKMKCGWGDTRSFKGLPDKEESFQHIADFCNTYTKEILE